MTDDNFNAQERANKHFKDLRADKTSSASKQMNIERVKADSEKTARLRAARLAKAAEDRAKGKPTPPAGPHDKPELTNPDATPGAGTLPDETPKGDVDGGAG